MGTALNESSTPRRHMVPLTEHELEVCVLHFVEGRSLELIAEWLGLHLRTIEQSISRAQSKMPALRALCIKSRQKIRRPKILLFSELTHRDRRMGPFNVDDV